ncbi:MAG: DUF1080 domain-containing protein [Candidatus Poribacteria bacterium]
MSDGQNTLTDAERNDGWQLLFDGASLDGWGTTGNDDGWATEDGTIVCTVSGGGYLYTEEQFEDYCLAVDFKINPGCNSGIFFMWSDLDDPVNTGLEIQILDTYGPGRTGVHDCGAVYELVPPKKQTMRPAGEWNQIVLTFTGDDVSIDMNGENIVEMDISEWTEPHKHVDGSRTKFTKAWASLPRRGHIGLQDHGGKLWFRNVKIRSV